MKAKLEAAGKKVVATDVAHSACHELDMKRIFRQNKEAAGVGGRLPGPVLRRRHPVGARRHRRSTSLPGTDSLFVGQHQARRQSYEEKCSLCGECVLDEYGAICPVTRCAKGILNGPCGGTNHGKCEVDPDKDCAWVLIYNQLKAEDKLDKFLKIHGPKNFNAVQRARPAGSAAKAKRRGRRKHEQVPRRAARAARFVFSGEIGPPKGTERRRRCCTTSTC